MIILLSINNLTLQIFPPQRDWTDGIILSVRVECKLNLHSKLVDSVFFNLVYDSLNKTQIIIKLFEFFDERVVEKIFNTGSLVRIFD
jgi:hypothetical protein